MFSCGICETFKNSDGCFWKHVTLLHNKGLRRAQISNLQCSPFTLSNLLLTRWWGMRLEHGFTLKCIRDMIRTFSQMHRTDKYSQHSSIIWPVWLNGWVFVYELSGCGFESSCSHLNFKFCTCFEQGFPWH